MTSAITSSRTNCGGSTLHESVDRRQCDFGRAAQSLALSGVRDCPAAFDVVPVDQAILQDAATLLGFSYEPEARASEFLDATTACTHWRFLMLRSSRRQPIAMGVSPWNRVDNDGLSREAAPETNVASSAAASRLRSCQPSAYAEGYLLSLLRSSKSATSEQALRAGNGKLMIDYSFENNVTIRCAVMSGMDVIVTRNLPDFTNSPVPTISPADLLNRIHTTAS
jgi:hypothetical protein